MAPCLWALLALTTNSESYPPLCDLEMFPDRKIVQAVWERSGRFQEWCDSAGPLSPRPDLYADAKREATVARNCWDLVRLAHHDGFCPDTRREKLNTLRRLLGDTAYYNGQLPPPVPVWRFRYIGD